MLVNITQTSTNVVKTITFTAETETPAQLRTAARTWMTTNYPAMTLQDIFSRITSFDLNHITLDMT